MPGLQYHVLALLSLVTESMLAKHLVSLGNQAHRKETSKKRFAVDISPPGADFC